MIQSNLNILTGGAMPYSIHWVRHAESCSNYNTDYIIDKPNDLYNSSNTVYKTPLKTKELSASSLEPPLSYIGMSQAIMLGNKYFSDKTHIYDCYISSPMVRTITTALLALRGKSVVIYVIPFINETNYKKENKETIVVYTNKQKQGVPSIFLKKKIYYIQKLIKKNWFKYYDDIEFLIELQNLYSLFPPDLQTKINKLFSSKTTQPHKKCNWVSFIKIIKKYKNTLDNKIHQFIKKYENLMSYNNWPTVDFSKYEEYEKIYSHPEVGASSYEKFNTVVLPELLKTIQKPHAKICAFAHGGFIKELYEKNTKDKNQIDMYSIMNTAIISQTYLKTSSSTFKIEYEPEKLRVTYGPSLEITHPNLCSLDNLMGKLNRMPFTPT